MLLRITDLFSASSLRVLRRFVCFAAVSALLGCSNTRRVVNLCPPPPLPSYHDLKEGIPIRRVAVLPLSYEAGNVNFPRDMDAAFNAELSKTSMFELVVVGRPEMEAIFGRQQVSSVGALPGEFLGEIAAQFGVDAVLFTDITHYFPYQPISIGVRTKLVDVRSGEIRWAFDYLFDSGKPKVAATARQFFLTNTQTNLPVKNDGDSVLQSPLRFSRYVAWETYRSLVSKPAPAMTILTTSTKVLLKPSK